MEPVSRKHIPERFLFDVRLIESNLKDGVISNQEITSHLESVEDVGTDYVNVETIPPGLDLTGEADVEPEDE
ncbi:MAG: hypothetical protein JXR95_10975 [Deltaproteobacteria bacterium]|nr:hypothetical protein [Deltaproteobacteria bacterium]